MSVPDDTLSAASLRRGRADGLHDYLAEGIRELIVRGALEGGARISEADLCARFGVSRTPLREALKALSVEGLVELRPNRGAAIAPLEPERLKDVFEAKGVIEHFIGLNAAVNATEADVAALEGLHERLFAAEQANVPERYTELNEAFHLALARLSGNAEIVSIYERLQRNVLRARYRINDDPERVRESLAEHDGIMAALRVRARLDLADRLVRHNETTAAAIMAKLGGSSGESAGG